MTNFKRGDKVKVTGLSEWGFDMETEPYWFVASAGEVILTVKSHMDNIAVRIVKPNQVSHYTEEVALEKPPETFPWVKGDKVTITGFSGAEHKVRLTEVGDGYYKAKGKRRGRSKVNYCFMEASAFGKSMVPRGKKTKARYAQWEQDTAEHAAYISEQQNKIKVGDWVEFTEDYSHDCKIGTKVQVKEIDLSYSQPLIRYQVPVNSREGSSFVGRVKKCEAPDPWEGVEWASWEGMLRSVKYMNNKYGSGWKSDGWDPIQLEDLSKEELIKHLKKHHHR